MKTVIKYSNYGRLALALCGMLISGCSCSAPKPTPDPLAGFHVSSLGNLDSNKAITDDYKAYIQTLSPEEKKYLGPSPVNFFEDGTGRHAIVIIIGLNGTWWRHVLVYDKDNKRTNTIKSSTGRYSS